MVIAQRYVIGWVRGDVESLQELSDGEARELVDRALAGEAVDTPLGRYAPGRSGSRSISFSDRRASPVENGVHRLEFTLTPQGADASRHSVLVRESDGKVVGWSSVSP